MPKITWSAVLGAAALFLLPCLSAQAQLLTRTWVSGVGMDSNACSRTAPCLTFNGALAKTAAGGVINCLDPGGFGPVTITISVTIDCEEMPASILAPNGATGVNINGSGSSITVHLRGLDIQGTGTGDTGIGIGLATEVSIRKCKISGFQGGTHQFGISWNAPAASTPAKLVITDTLIHSNGTGIDLETNGPVNMTVRDVIVHSNGSGIFMGATTTHAGATIDRSTIVFNFQGLGVIGSGAIAIIGASTVTGNSQGVAVGSGGTVLSFKDNKIGGNSTDGTPLPAFTGPNGQTLQ